MRAWFSADRRRALIQIAGSLIAAALLIHLLSRQGWDEIGRAIARVGWPRATGAVALVLASRLAVAWRWHALLRGAEAPIRAARSVALTFAGLFAANFLPTTIGGDVVRLAGAFRLNLDRAVSAASLVADRLIGMFCMAWALPFGIGPLVEGARATSSGPGNPLAVLMTAEIGWLGRARARILHILRKLLQALLVWRRKPGALIEAALASFVHMGLFFTSQWLLLQGMGERTSWILIAGLWSLVYFASLVPISINGLGLQELSLVYVYGTFGGVSAASALALAVMIRTLFVLASLPGALFLASVPLGAAADRSPAEAPR